MYKNNIISSLSQIFYSISLEVFSGFQFGHPLPLDYSNRIVYNCSKTSLLDEDEIPKVLLDLLAHILEFRIALKGRKDEYTEVAETSCKYPGQALLKYCEEKFRELKTEQNKLIKEKK